MIRQLISFPPFQALVSHLVSHPRCRPYLSQKPVIDKMAKAFAGKEQAPLGVDYGVALTLADLNVSKNLADMQADFSEALKDWDPLKK